MDRPLLRNYSAPPTRPQCRPSPVGGPIQYAGRRRRRKSVSLSPATKALRLAISQASSLQRLLPMPGDFLDLFLRGGGEGDGRIPPIWTMGRRGWKAIDARLFALALASAFVLVGRIPPELELGIRVFVPVILGLRIPYWKRWVGFPIMWITMQVFGFCGRRRRK